MAGYAVKGDLGRLASSFPEIACFQSCCPVLDLQVAVGKGHKGGLAELSKVSPRQKWGEGRMGGKMRGSPCGMAGVPCFAFGQARAHERLGAETSHGLPGGMRGSVGEVAGDRGVADRSPAVFFPVSSWRTQV